MKSTGRRASGTGICAAEAADTVVPRAKWRQEVREGLRMVVELMGWADGSSTWAVLTGGGFPGSMS